MKLRKFALYAVLPFLVFASVFHPFYIVLSAAYAGTLAFEATYLRGKGAVQVREFASRFGVQRRTAKKRRGESDK